MNTNSFWDYAAIVRKRLWVVLLLFAATMIIILARAWSTPLAYSASMLLQVMPLESEEVPLFTRTTGTTSTSSDVILFQFETAVRSQGVALRTIADTGVSVSPAALLERVDFQREPGGDLASVIVTADSPQDAERVVQTHVKNALAELRSGRTRALITTGKFLHSELDNAEAELQTARDELRRFKLTNSVDSLEKEILAAQDANRNLRSAQESADMEAQRLTAMATELERQSAAAQAKAAAAPPESDEAASWLRLARDLYQTAINRRVEAAGQKSMQASYYTTLSEHENRLALLITLTEEYVHLEDVVREKETTRDFLAGKAREADLKERQSQTVGYLEIVGEPHTASAPLTAYTLRIALLGGALSLVAGIVLVFVLEFLAQTLRQTPKRPAPKA